MERLTLKRNGAEVDVWSASLPSMDERRQSVARGQLRAILAGYLDASASEIVFQIGRHGKPVLAGPHGAAGSSPQPPPPPHPRAVPLIPHQGSCGGILHPPHARVYGRRAHPCLFSPLTCAVA